MAIHIPCQCELGIQRKEILTKFKWWEKKCTGEDKECTICGKLKKKCKKEVQYICDEEKKYEEKRSTHVNKMKNKDCCNLLLYKSKECRDTGRPFNR